MVADRGALTPDRFDYSPIIDRPVIKWPSNARVAVWVAPNMEWYEYTPLNRPTKPDIAHYSYRDYGNRVGFWRMQEVTDQHDLEAPGRERQVRRRAVARRRRELGQLAGPCRGRQERSPGQKSHRLAGVAQSDV